MYLNVNELPIYLLIWEMAVSSEFFYSIVY